MGLTRLSTISFAGFSKHWPFLILLLVTSLLYLPGTATLPLMDRDEPRFARATIEMMNRSTLVVPYFNDQYRFDKPPLTYWWMQLHYRLLGTHELAARLHSLVAVFLISCLLFSMAKRLAGITCAWFASLSWLTSLQVLVHGRLCVADMPMVLAVTLTNWALFELLVKKPTNSFANDTRNANWVLWISLALGFLAKGPIALLVPVVTCGLFRCVFWRQPLPWKKLNLLWGSLGMLALISAWGIPALFTTKGAFWTVGMGEHIVERGTAVFNGRRFIPFYYLGTALISLFPWIAFLGLIWPFIRREWNVQIAFLFAWILAPQLIFFLYATQLPHYVMPGFPAFALLFGLAIHHAHTANQSISMRPLWILTLIFCAVPSSILLLLLNLPPSFPKDLATLLWSSTQFLFLLFIGGALLPHLWIRQARFKILLSLAWLLLFSFQLHAVAGQLRSTNVSVQTANLLNQTPSTDLEFRAWHYTEPSLVYYTNHSWKMSSGSTDKLRQSLNTNKIAGAVLLSREWTLSGAWQRWLNHQPTTNTAPDTDHSLPLTTLLADLPHWKPHYVYGFNAARTSWAEVIVLLPVP